MADKLENPPDSIIPAPSNPGTLPSSTIAVPAPPVAYVLRVCCINLNGTDRIRLIATPPTLVDPIRQTILACWGPIQKEGNFAGAHEYKLLGNPWDGGGVEAVNSRKLLIGLLRTMAQHGWNLIQASDVSKKQYDKDSLFFEGSMVPVVGQVDMFSISFHGTDRIRLIDVPPFIIPLVKGAIQAQWRKGIQSSTLFFKAHEFKLNGNPFWGDGEDVVLTHVMLAQILSTLREQGYKLYSSANINSGQPGGFSMYGARHLNSKSRDIY
ncbi:hypothetical protein BGZ80_010681 [Entomortierella chlamydospora]|uniref:Uncharacterized protein n=1 Tax=Entomortierella chlamydospora TaxID=101097 RepID=A0A9P6MVB9_9FUNG|nr:hypothetical protein BGZ79_005776 [Entomortierella chlamydospora]KAG0014056.1 hypothetical protein BGZ80_010681 [Entomortierella chlamydospora]